MGFLVNIFGYIFLGLCLGIGCASGASIAVESSVATAPIMPMVGYELPAEIEVMIERYQSDEFIDEMTRSATRFQDPDFIHRVMHRREAARESIDALNKKVLYRFPFFMRAHKKAIGILGSDAIGVATHLIQKYLDRAAMKSFMHDISEVIAHEVAQHGEQLTAMLASQDIAQASAFLINMVWQAKTVRPLLMAYLKRRLPFTLLEYAKKSVTPLPFFMHGKTKDGQEVDSGVERIIPITSVIPVLAIDGFLDPILNSNLLTGNTNFRWDDPSGDRINALLTINADYALEGAKQLEWIGDMDEGLLFIVVKELAMSMLFFHRELRTTMQMVVQKSLLIQGSALKKLLTDHATLQRDVALAPDVRSIRNKESINSLNTLFSSTLSSRGGDLLRSLRNAQCIYNVALTGAILAPVAFKTVKFCWKILKAMNTTDGGDKK